MSSYCIEINSPVGPLVLIADSAALLSIEFEAEEQHVDHNERQYGEQNEVLRASIEQLEAYFSGKLKVFDLPLSTSGTEFQRSVWSALPLIPYGETRSYRQVALAIEKPNAVRAVGRANAANPLPIVIPCHRVIGADGSLTGFGGGLWRKQYLLMHEARQKSFV